MKEAEQEAREIYAKFEEHIPEDIKIPYEYYPLAKQCALIAIDMVLEELRYHDYPIKEGSEGVAFERWEKVRTEIEKLKL